MMPTEMLKDVEAIIFDMDGTLIDSMWVWTAVDEDYLAKYHLERPTDFHEEMEGKSYTEVAQFFLDVFPSLNKTLDEVMDEWYDMAVDKYLHAVTLKKGVCEFLTEMRKQGKKIGIATSNAYELVAETLEALHIQEFFDSVHSACEVKAGKPSPDVYLLVAEDLQVAPSNCLVFEDVPMGILAGKNAGMKVCGVDDEFSRHQEVRKKELADYYIRDYDEIKAETYEVLK